MKNMKDYESHVDFVGKDKESVMLTKLEKDNQITYMRMSKILFLRDHDHYMIDAVINLRALVEAYRESRLVPFAAQRTPRLFIRTTTNNKENEEYYDKLILSLLDNYCEPHFSIVMINGKACLANGLDRMTLMYDIIYGRYIFNTLKIDGLHKWLGVKLYKQDVKDLREDSDEWNEIIDNADIPIKFFIPLDPYNDETLAYEVFKNSNTNIEQIECQHSYNTDTNAFIKRISSPMQFKDDGSLIEAHLLKSGYTRLLTECKNLDKSNKYYNLSNYKFVSTVMAASHVKMFSDLKNTNIEDFIKTDKIDAKKWVKIEKEIMNIHRIVRENMKQITAVPKILSRMNYTALHLRELIIFWRYFEKSFNEEGGCNLKIKDNEKFWSFIGKTLADEKYLGSVNKEGSAFHARIRGFVVGTHQKECAIALAKEIKTALDNGQDIGIIAVDPRRAWTEWDGKTSNCYITGHTTNNPHTGHIIPWIEGGITQNPNLVSIDGQLNDQLGKRFLSEYTQNLIDTNKELFTSQTLHEWQNGRMEKIIEIEKDTSNYATFICP